MEVMMGEDIVTRPQDYDQVLFAGWNTMELMGLMDIIPTGHGEFVEITAFTTRLKGLKYDYYTARSIDTKRICKQPIIIGGKRTLVVLADLFSVDNNKSFMDLLTMDKDNEIDRLRMNLKYIRQQSEMLLGFVKERNLEENFKEYLLNVLDFYRTHSVKVAGKTEIPAVSFELEPGKGEKKEKGI